MAVITPLAGAVGVFKLGSTLIQMSQWSFTITLSTGDILHFNSQQDGNSNYWPTNVKNFATGEGSASGKVDNSTNLIPIDGTALYIGVTGTIMCGWSSTNGITFPAMITGVDGSQDAGGQEGGDISFKFKFTGPPTRVLS